MTQLWVDKYKPKTFEEVAGQEKGIKEFLRALRGWKGGKAIFLHGPPGVGKSLCVEIAAKDAGLFFLTVNASDPRSSKEIEDLLSSPSMQKSLFYKGMLICIDEVDGISSRDRGAIKSIISLIKKSRHPVVLIANDAYEKNLRELRKYSTLIKFNRLRASEIEKRLRFICESENIRVKDDCLKELAKWSNGDMRSAIMDLQLVATGKGEISISDMNALGFRERESDIFRVLQTIFFSGSINACKRAISSSDKDPDEIFLWVENNAFHFISNKNLPDAYELISKADYFRSLVRKQQNWRFRLFMIDLISGISAHVDRRAFFKFSPPLKMLSLSRSREARMVKKEVLKKIGNYVHASTNIVNKYYLPYIKIVLRSGKGFNSGVELEESDAENLTKD